MVTSEGWLIHVRGGVVLASPLDGGDEIRLDAGSVAPTLAQFAGASTDGSGVSVYLLAATQRVDIPPGGPLFDVSVIRTSLSSGSSEELLRFGPLYLGDGAPPYTAVSPDGLRIAYGGPDGVHVSQMGATFDEYLFSTDCTGSERCPQYRSPLWSPDGQSLLLTKQLYEGSHLAVVRLSDPATVHEFENVSGDVKTWSPDSSRICSLPEIFIPDGIWLIDATTLESQRFERDAHGVIVTGTRCHFDAFGEVALGFERAGEPPLASVIFNADDPAATPMAIPAPYTTVEAWLPGGPSSHGGGIIVSGYAPCVPCGERDPSVAVLLPDGTLRPLPFVAGRVLAVVPAAP